MKKSNQSGFTLIELSIVLTIIGLLVGSILVGQNMIESAAIRAQISQIDKYNASVYAFQLKYGGLPGDLPDPAATSYGFIARGTTAGSGDGNGIIEAYNGVAANGYSIGGGETGVFWNDLTVANLINARLTAAISGGLSALITSSTTPNIDNYLPQAKIGAGNYIHIFSSNSINYFGLSQVTNLSGGSGITSSPGLSVQQAYNIDQKVDDGLPQTGKVSAQYSYLGTVSWAGGSNGHSGTADTSATAPSVNTCYDNGNAAGVQHYSTAVNSGTNINCALSFQFR